MSNYKDIKSKLFSLIKESKDKGKIWLKGETENKYISYFSGGIFILYIVISFLTGPSLSNKEAKDIEEACLVTANNLTPADPKANKKYCKCTVKKARNKVSKEEYDYYSDTGASLIQDPSKMTNKIKKLNKIMDICYAKYYK